MRQLLASVERARRGLVVAQRTRALLLALGVALATMIVVRLIMAAGSATPVTRPAMLVALAIGLAFGAGAWWIVRPRRHPSPAVAALWIEERQTTDPTFALVSLVEQAAYATARGATGERERGGRYETAVDVEHTPLFAAAQQIVQRVAVGEALDRVRWQQWRGPLAFVVAGMALLIMSVVWPRTMPVVERSAIDGSPTAGDVTIAPLGVWTVRVTPPAHAGGRVETLGDATTVSALEGSVVEVQGEGDMPQVSGGRADSPLSQELPARRVDGGWLVRTRADSVPTALRVMRGARTRLLVIEGHRDTIPSVTLEAPARDSVFREAAGTLSLAASARDDIGLTRAWFELIISSGEGERFTVRTVTLGTQNWPANARRRQAGVAATLDLAQLQLAPGDVVHLRAVARDGHPSASRDLGSSETRSFRIARPAEYDSVAVEPAPPPDVDKSLLSQRMLLMLTEKLDRQRPRMARGDVVRESQKLARDQARLRQAVSDVIFQRLSGEASGEHSHFAGDGHDHGVDEQGGKLALNSASTSGMLEEGDDSPVIAINKPLLEAYNAMWDAGRALEQGDPHAAIPPMRLALEAIERSRAASRVYLRGRPPQVIVDIAKVRLAGKDTGLVSPRSARAAVPRREMERDARLVSVARQLAEDGAPPDVREAARDSLALLRVEALGDAPAFAASLGRVLDGLARGGDITTLLVDARRTLGNVERASAGRWSRMMPR